MAKFSKRHYVAVASKLSSIRPVMARYNSQKEISTREGWDRCVEALANLFAADNALFKRERFLDACGYGGQCQEKALEGWEALHLMNVDHLRQQRDELLAALEKIASGNVMAKRVNFTHAEVVHEYTRIASAAIAKVHP